MATLPVRSYIALPSTIESIGDTWKRCAQQSIGPIFRRRRNKHCRFAKRFQTILQRRVRICRRGFVCQGAFQPILCGCCVEFLGDTYGEFAERCERGIWLFLDQFVDARPEALTEVAA